MTTKISRRLFIKRSFTTIFTTFTFTAGGYLYANKIEPSTLHINKLNFQHENLTDDFISLKIVQFGDTHLGFQYSLTQLQQLVTKINTEKPDLIFFTGDLIDDPNNFKNVAQVTSILSKLEASYGKYSVFGNHDHGGYGTKLYRTIMEDADFKLLLNEVEMLRINNNNFAIIGIDDAMLGKPNFEQSLQNVAEDSIKILLSHAPDLADKAQSYNIDFQFSGHSHGGQVKIPFFGPLVKPPFGEKYVEGTYEIGKKKPLILHVNRGLGTTRLPLRFLSRPELTIISLSNNIN